MKNNKFVILVIFIILISTVYCLFVYKHKSTETQYSLDTLEKAKKPANQIKNDVGIDQYGNLINLDEWCYEIIGENSFRTYGMSGYVNSAGYLGAAEDVNMPAYIKMNGKIYELTEIGAMTFSNCKNVKHITIPNSVTSIYSYAFERMYKFKKYNNS